MSSPTATRQIARAAVIVMIAFAAGQLIGLVRQMLVAPAFGTGPELDSFNAANRLAEFLFNLVAGGALGSAFIPTFTGLLTTGHPKDAWRLASAVANLVVLVLILLSALLAFFAPQVVRHGLFLLDPSINPGQEILTIRLLRILLLTVTIFGLSGLVMGILNAHQVFLLPALAPSMYNLGMIFGVIFLAPTLGIDGLAWGAVLGALGHLLIQIPGLLRLGGGYTPTLGLRHPAVLQVLQLIGPRLFGVAVVQINLVVNTIIAFSLPDGSVTSLAIGFQLMYMPLAAIAQSVAVAALPTFSAQVAHGKLDDMRTSLAAALRGVLLLALPASVGLILIAQPLVAALYQRGPHFTAESTAMVAWALGWYAAGLVGHSFLEIISRAFYALKDTRTPVLIGAASVALNVVLSLVLTRVFARLNWLPLGGLGLANSIATALEVAVLLFILRRRLNGLEGSALFSALGQSGLAAVVMTGALFAWLAAGANLSAWLLTLGGVLLGGAAYGAVLLALKVPEAASLLALIRRRIPLH